MINRTSSYEKLIELLTDYSIIIEDARDKKKIPSQRYFNAGNGASYYPINIPPSKESINEAFAMSDVHKITDMVVNVTSIMGSTINKRKALLLLEEAYKGSLPDEVYKLKHKYTYGCFFRNKEIITITCGQKLNDTQKALTSLPDIDNEVIWAKQIVVDQQKAEEKEAAWARFSRI